MRFIFISLLILLFSSIISQTRNPAVSGQWYPADKEKLKNMLKKFYNNVELTNEQRNLIPYGIVSPHAGFVYSGQVAMNGYYLLKNRDFQTVILLGTSHHYLNNKISVYNGDYYESPLGNVPINKQIAEKIISDNPNIGFYQQLHSKEHSLEAQIPFIQFMKDSIEIVPIVVSTRDFSKLDRLAEIITEIVEENPQEFLFVASTDMSHYHNYSTACKMDKKVSDMIIAKKWSKLKDDIVSGKSELCGYYSFYVFRKVLGNIGYQKPHLLKYANSGDIKYIGNKSRVVGYSSIVFTEEPEDKNTFTLSDSEKEKLLALARKSIEYSLKTGKKYTPPVPDNEKLRKELAVFVTLNKNGHLRGCIGQLKAREALYKAVANMAYSAAFNDYRFSSVSEQELADINIEISVLTPPQKIKDIDKIKMGRDGVWIKKGFSSGVYLPQVAEETGWDKKTFLESLCSSKAGLAKDAYLDEDTDIYIFQVCKFKER